MRVTLALLCVGLFSTGCTSESQGEDGAGQEDRDARSLLPVEGSGSGEPLERCTEPGCVTDLAAAGERTCAVMGDGRLYCWGIDIEGGLGVGATDGYAWMPARVIGPEGSGSLEGVVDVAVSAIHTCAVLESGRVPCWGINSRGQLGDGTQDARVAPVEVAGITNATNVAVADEYSCALLAARTVRCWGNNSHGELGDGREQNSPTPTQVVAVSGDGPLEGVVQVEVGGDGTCALLESGEVVCWGEARDGKLGTSPSDHEMCGPGRCSRRPVRVPGLDSVVHIGRSWLGTCAVLASGEQRCWGGTTRAAGAEPRDDELELALTPIATLGPSGDAPLGGVKAAIAGGEHMCALLRDGQLACWGNDVNQETGRLRKAGEHNNPGLPAYVVGPGETGTLQRVVLAAAGKDHTCAVNDAGELYCWGATAPAGLGRAAGNGCGGHCARAPGRVVLPR